MTTPIRFSQIAQMVKTAQSEGWTDDQINGGVRSLFAPGESTVVLDGMSETMVEVLLEDLAQKGEDWCLTIQPLGDGVGWRSSVLAGIEETCLGVASAVSWSSAVSTAIARATARLQESEEAEMDSREQ